MDRRGDPARRLSRTPSLPFGRRDRARTGRARFGGETHAEEEDETSTPSSSPDTPAVAVARGPSSSSSSSSSTPDASLSSSSSSAAALPPRPLALSGARSAPSLAVRVESSARESGRGGGSGRSRASGSAEESGDFYRTSLRLRAARSEILRIRGKLQTFAHCKYPNLRKLMQQFDLDRNGEISLSDWLGGLKEHNFPVTEPEARLLFAGLDEDGSNGLSYSELVWLFQPASLASLPPPADPRKKHVIEDIVGFTHFTKHQQRHFEEQDLFTPRGTFRGTHDDSMAASIRSATKVVVADKDLGMPVDTEGRVDLGDPALDPPPRMDPATKRVPKTRQEEIQHLKAQVGRKLNRRGAEFFRAFERFDINNRGYVTQAQFVTMVGPEGFALGLDRRQLRQLVTELVDESGVIDAITFDKWLREEPTDVPTVVALEESKTRALNALRARVDSYGETHAAFAEALGPPVIHEAPWSVEPVHGERPAFVGTKSEGEMCGWVRPLGDGDDDSDDDRPVRHRIGSTSSAGGGHRDSAALSSTARLWETGRVGAREATHGPDGLPLHPLLRTLASGPAVQEKVARSLVVGNPTDPARPVPSSPRFSDADFETSLRTAGRPRHRAAADALAAAESRRRADKDEEPARVAEWAVGDRGRESERGSGRDWWADASPVASPAREDERGGGGGGGGGGAGSDRREEAKEAGFPSEDGDGLRRTQSSLGLSRSWGRGSLAPEVPITVLPRGGKRTVDFSGTEGLVLPKVVYTHHRHPSELLEAAKATRRMGSMVGNRTRSLGTRADQHRERGAATFGGDVDATVTLSGHFGPAWKPLSEATVDVLDHAESRAQTWRTTMRPNPGHTAALLEPEPGTALFASADERFVRKSMSTRSGFEREDPKDARRAALFERSGGGDKGGAVGATSSMLSKWAARRAAEERIARTYEREQLLREEQERSRIVGKSIQQLRYADAMRAAKGPGYLG